MMKIKSIFIILALATTCAFANEEVAQEPSNKAISEQQTAEDRIFKLLSGGSDPFSYGTSRGINADTTTLVPIDISNITTSIKLRGVFKLSTSREAYALIQIGEDRRQLVKKDDLILINQDTKSYNKSKTLKYLQIVEVLENTITIAPQMSPDEQIVIR